MAKNKKLDDAVINDKKSLEQIAEEKVKMATDTYKLYIDENKDELIKQAIIKKYKGLQPKSKKMKVLTKRQKKDLKIDKDQGCAHLKYARVSARKAKVVIDLIRGKDIDVARAILKNTSRSASDFLIKLLDSAVANMEVNISGSVDTSECIVAEAYANQGPTLKRIMPRAQGRANRIRKRTSHLTIVVREKKL